jgi:iron(III) transport system substrate-binding protein
MKYQLIIIVLRGIRLNNLLRVSTYTILFISLILIGPSCSESVTISAGPVETKTTTVFKKSAEGPQKSNSLVIYSGRSEKLVAPIIEQFALTSGFNVQVKYGKTAEIAATIMEEGNNSPADLFFAQDPGGLGVLEANDMFIELPQQVVSLVPYGKKSETNQWVGITGRARTLVHNTDIAKEDLPNDLWELVNNNRWKGRIGYAPTNGSFQAMVSAMRAEWGEAKTEEWLKALLTLEPLIYPKNTPQVAAAAAGEIDIGLVNHYYVHRFIADEGDAFKARNHHLPSGGPGSIVLVAGAGILKTAKNQENAILFLKYLLSPVGQQYFASQTYEYPLVEGIKTNRILTPLENINGPQISYTKMNDLQGTIDLLTKVGALQ